MEIKNKHNIDLETFGFFTREKRNKKTVANRCGRDFLYYALQFYYPNKFNPTLCSAKEMEGKGSFGLKLPSGMMWTLLQFKNTPKLLEKHGLQLYINNRHIHSWFDFLIAFLTPNKAPYEHILKVIHEGIRQQEAVGLDISLKYGGLLDHVMFVYGYDEENIYVFDTHQVPYLEYKKITEDNRFLMKVPHDVVKKRSGALGRIWRIVKK